MSLLSFGWIKVGFNDNGRAQALFDLLWEFIKRGHAQSLDIPTREKLCDALRFDYYLWERPNTVPDYLQLEVNLETEGKADPWKRKQDDVRRDAYWETLIPEFKQMDRRQWSRNTAVTYFTSDILQSAESNAPCWYLFYYQQGKAKAYRFDDEWSAVQ
ncbi:MAG TPA: DUF4080 domain-containing protein [Desulfosporosinus sp.]